MKAPQKSLRILATVVALVLAGTAHAADKKPSAKPAVATFAGGCFWCLEASLDFVNGVKSTTSGYAGGTGKNPTYHDYAKTGHTEVVQVEFDPSKVTYAELLQAFWHNIDPTSGDGQFCDRGAQYRPEIFYHDAAQKAAAEASKKDVEKKFGTVPVKITALAAFYPAEEYHQDYYMKDPDEYHRYRTGCGRDRRLKELWGDQAGKGHASK